MRKKLNKSEIAALRALQERIDSIWAKLEENDVELHHGNGTAADQLSVASASLECILQEYEEEVHQYDGAEIEVSFCDIDGKVVTDKAKIYYKTTYKGIEIYKDGLWYYVLNYGKWHYFGTLRETKNYINN